MSELPLVHDFFSVYRIVNKYNGLEIVYFGTMQNLKAFVPIANIYCESMLE